MILFFAQSGEKSTARFWISDTGRGSSHEEEEELGIKCFYLLVRHGSALCISHLSSGGSVRYGAFFFVTLFWFLFWLLKWSGSKGVITLAYCVWVRRSFTYLSAKKRRGFLVYFMSCFSYELPVSPVCKNFHVNTCRFGDLNVGRCCHKVSSILICSPTTPLIWQNL
jgi:hypothetical protein